MNYSSTTLIGIDPSAQKLTVALCREQPENDRALSRLGINEFENSVEGFTLMIEWIGSLAEPEAESLDSSLLFCIENTGVYNQMLCYWLDEQGHHLVLIPPQHIKRAATSLRKTDQVDAEQIAEYAWRFRDRLELWQPKSDILEHIRVLLGTREQLVGHRTAHKNVLKAFERSRITTPRAVQAHTRLIKELDRQIKEITKEIERLLKKDDDLGPIASSLISIPGVGWLLIGNLAVLTSGFTDSVNARSLASYCGICPHDRSSGSSVYRPARSTGHGPSRVRKLLHLAARSLKTHNRRFKEYYHRKKSEGKPGRLILNNIANKHLRIITAVILSGQPYVQNHHSMNPVL